MSIDEGIRILRHAADYIFFTRVIRGSQKTMCGSPEAWQALAALHACSNALEREQVDEINRLSNAAKSAVAVRCRRKRQQLPADKIRARKPLPKRIPTIGMFAWTERSVN